MMQLISGSTRGALIVIVALIPAVITIIDKAGF